MQERHKNRFRYFKELADTSRKYFVPYIQRHHAVETGANVLEIGCGEGGNLLPFAEMGCCVTGVDLAACRIEEARACFETERVQGEFIADDIFNLKGPEHKFDIIICHDVFEHIRHKKEFLSNLNEYLRPHGIVFMAFPAWQMPFGGHQQICRSRFLSHLPFFHLLPSGVYKQVLKSFGEDEGCVKELLSIKQTRVTIEHFEKLLKGMPLVIADRQLWLVNPHYEVKFNLSPRKLSSFLANIPYLRNFLCTSCFYILRGVCPGVRD